MGAYLPYVTRIKRIFRDKYEVDRDYCKQALDASVAYAKTFLCHSGALAIESLPSTVKATL